LGLTANIFYIFSSFLLQKILVSDKERKINRRFIHQQLATPGYAHCPMLLGPYEGTAGNLNKENTTGFEYAE
jgi:hypothetical protein